MDTYSNKTTQSYAHAALVETIVTKTFWTRGPTSVKKQAERFAKKSTHHASQPHSPEAYLDIQVHGLPELEGLFFDITIRHPRDARYAPALCAANDGVALQRASAEKQTRYPPPPMPAGKGRHPGGLKLGATLSRRRTYPGFVRCKRRPTRSHKRTPRIFRPPPQMERLP